MNCLAAEHAGRAGTRRRSTAQRGARASGSPPTSSDVTLNHVRRGTSGMLTHFHFYIAVQIKN